MSVFIHDDFMLKTQAARRLYHEFAEGLPIIDYHNHLDPRALAEDRRFDNMTQVWIAGDPYKHRAMRIAGVPEHCITGPASDREKFDHWAATVPLTLGNPLFHWTALELKRFFGIDELLSPASADRIWSACNERLASPEFSARQLLARANVARLCTSDGLLDDLAHHATLSYSPSGPRVHPSLRPDDILATRSEDYTLTIARLGVLTGTAIHSYETFLEAIRRRLDAFDAMGCRLFDYSHTGLTYGAFTEDKDPAPIFKRLLAGKPLSHILDHHTMHWRIVCFLAEECGRRGWILQVHMGAIRQTSTRLRDLAGPAGGYAAIGWPTDARDLCAFLDDLEKQGRLPRTILYNLNPADNAVLATLTGSFAEDGVRGKIQFGPAWWYNDHALGIRNHLETIASYGLLAAFIGMTTDSRSLLSMTRHEYFRRVLCGFLGDRVEAGLMPDDDRLLGGLIRAVACENAQQWIFPQKD